MDDDTTLELVTFFKTLIDPDRLAIAGRLVRTPATIEALAAELGLSRVDVQRHLGRLLEAGLAVEHDAVYSIDREGLQARARRVLSAHTGAPPPVDYPDKVLRDYVRPDGSLKDIPGQLKKKRVIYAHIVQHFENGRRYTEKEVKQLLGRFHPDTVAIRRDLVDLGFLDREADGSAYWRAPQP